MPLNLLSGSLLQFLISLTLALGLLWWLQSILVPIALAILLTFLLSPPVSWLQRRGVPRALSVVLMLASSVALGGGVAWTVALQINRLVDSYPEYQQHVDAKIAVLRSDGHGFFDKIQGIVLRVSDQLQKASRSPSAAARAAGKRGPAEPPAPQPVTVVEDTGPFHLSAVWRVIRPLLEPLATGGLTLVLSIFMLLRREDLRDRVIAVMGHGRLVATTKAFDDASSRISRYLVRQLVVNSGFGLVLAIGLTAIGVPYGVLWGSLAAVLRYLPYLGTWLAAIVPVALSFILTDGWQPVILVAALFLALDLITNMFIEPKVYGQGVGVSETGTLIMVAFWTWLWGPVGLILATPLTVCVVVLGKYVHVFRYFNMLLGDRPALPADVNFYQRLLANDVHEATLIATQAVSAGSYAQACDDLMRPALAYVRRDAAHRQLTDQEERTALDACEQVARNLAVSGGGPPEALPLNAAQRRPLVLLVPTRDASSASAAMVFNTLPIKDRYEVETLSGSLLASEVNRRVMSAQPFAVVITVVAEDSAAQVKLLCHRIRRANADLTLIVGLWTVANDASDDETSERFQAAGADYVGVTFMEVRSYLDSQRLLLPVS